MTAKPASKTEDIANSLMKMSPSAKAKMRATEKDVYRYYNDMGRSKGHCTWGAGILAHKGVCSAEELEMKVSIDMIDQEFERRVAAAQSAVRRNVRVALTQAQFDALCSVTYNRGAGGTRDTYDLVNQGKFEEAASNISRMIKVEVIKRGKKKYVVAPGLIKRREEESAPFRIKQETPGK